jgi:integrase
MAGKLTVLKVKSLTSPGRYGDGGGLWLQVRKASHKDESRPAPPPSRSWLFRFMIAGSARQMGLGPLEDVGLAEARAAAAECRKLLLGGLDPIAYREATRAAQKKQAATFTFKEVAERYIAAHESTWRHAKHRAQWRTSLSLHAYPILGDLPIDKVTTAEVMRVLEPIWQIKPETASRVRSRMEALLDYAKSREWRSGENPARWRGHVGNMLPKRNRARSVQHFPALPWKQMSSFMSELRGEPGVGALALQFTILTAVRTGETLGATWLEIDVSRSIWTIPGERMKAGKEHRIPLSPEALKILRAAADMRTDNAEAAYVFLSTRPQKPLSNMAMAMLLRRMKRADLTVHGFRSTFRDWAAEATNYPREVAEAALAHSLTDKVEAAYFRSDLFEKRRLLMEDWAAFCTEVPALEGTGDA